ncbi:MAG: helix-turn-helix transcriptional regulator [Desulfovibrionaceae bacterium]|nr:helix-turn-helix transcriptional regulator [Desulfovibrionaceae bacterium]
MPFISNLSEIMKEKNITYEELQFLSKVAPDTVARARDERIATCKLLTLEKLAKALDVNVDELFEYVNKKIERIGTEKARK